MKIDISVDTNSGHANFDKRKTINILGSTDGIITHNFLVRVFKGGGVDTGNNMYLYGNCLDTFDDIIFSTGTSGSPVLKHKRFGVLSGVSAFFLVEYTSLPASPTVSPVYLHYEYSGASNTSVDTHLGFHDDFTDYTVPNTPSAAKWTESQSTGDWLTATAGDDQVGVLNNPDASPGPAGAQSVFVKNGLVPLTNFAIGYAKWQSFLYTPSDNTNRNAIATSNSSASSTHSIISFNKTGDVLEYFNQTDVAYENLVGDPVLVSGSSATYYEYIFLYNNSDADSSHFWVIDVNAAELTEYNNLTGFSNGTINGLYFQASQFASGAPGESKMYLDEVFFDDYGATITNMPTLSVPASALVLTNIEKGVSVSSVLRGGGQLSFKYLDNDLANFSTIVGWINAQISVTNDSASRTYFWGELRDYKLEKNGVRFQASEMLRKLQKLHCEYNPTLKAGTIKYIEGTEAGNVTTLFDYAEAWTGLNSKIIIAQDSDKTRVINHPIAQDIEGSDGSNMPNGSSFDPLNSSSDTTEFGSFKNLYFRNPDLEYGVSYQTNANSILHLHGAMDNEAVKKPFHIVYDFEVYLKSGTTLVNDEMRVRAKFYTDGTSGYITNPRIYIYDYTGVTWFNATDGADPAVTFTRTTTAGTIVWTDGGAGTMTVEVVEAYEVEFIIKNVLATTFLDSQGANSQDFVQYDMRLAFFSGATATRAMKMIVEYVEVEFVTDFATDGISNVITEGKQSVLTTNATSLVLAGSASSPLFARDGVVAGDRYAVTENISTIMTNIWTNSGASAYFALSSASEDDVGDAQDLTNVTVYDLLTKYAKLLDREFWQEGSTVYFPSSFTASGIAFTEADILNYHTEGSWYYGIDSKLVRSKLKIFGVDNIAHTETITPEYTTNEVEQINDAEIGSNYEATTAGNKIATTRHKNAVKVAAFQIDVERTDKDYSNARLGFTATFTAKSGTMSPVTMIFEELHIIESGNRDLITVVLYKRG